MNLEELQELLADPDNWPDESTTHWPAEWKLFYWATKEVHTDSAKLLSEVDERGLNELFLEVLAQLRYEVTETPSGKNGINLSRKEQIYSVRRIARFLLEIENMGKSSQILSSELRELGYHA